MKRIIGFVLFVIATFGILYFLQAGVAPQIGQQVALAQASDTDAGHAMARAYFGKSNLIASDIWYLVLLAIGAWLFKPWKAIKTNTATATAVVLCLCMVMTGCWKPYNKPEYVEVATHETAFVVPLEGKSTDQVKLDSAAAYDKFKVMTKRIQLDKRWNQTGRISNDGEWIPTVKVIKVDRSPVTREWCADTDGGTNKKNEAIWAESSDSIGFSTGFNCTGYVAEADTSKFLYWYPNTGLAIVMDSEIRNRIQQIVAEVSNKYTMDILRAQKQELIDSVRKDVIPFYAERGITITTIGQYGGFTYENPDIQKAIDNVFVAQQEKAKEKSLLEAMGSKKSRLQDEGTATANQKREEAKGTADAILLVKTSEAQGITLLNDALKKAEGNPIFLSVKSLEVEEKRIARWNGDVPQWITGNGSGGFVPMVNIPPHVAAQEPVKAPAVVAPASVPLK